MPAQSPFQSDPRLSVQSDPGLSGQPNAASHPIGVFDSGLGGLTVVHDLRKALPSESIVYVGDTARVPYGIKSPESIRRYSREITRFLVDHGVKLVLIACNTVSAHALQDVREEAGGIPVLDVLSAGVQAVVGAVGTSAAAASPTAVTPSHAPEIGVLGTLATVGSGLYERRILERLPAARVHSKACPLLVPLAEEGWIDHPASRLTLQEYLGAFRGRRLASLILGCTHYPLFRNVIAELLEPEHPGVAIVDSAQAAADAVRAQLGTAGFAETGKRGQLDCFVTDRPQRFGELAGLFLGENLPSVDLIRL